jgi:multiple RNA-binding domain-containing protein 1
LTLPENASRSNKDKATETKSTSQLDEFLEVMQPRTKKGPAWANDMKSEDVVPTGKTKHKQKAAEDIHTDVQGDDPALEVTLSDLDWMKKHMSQNVDVVEKVFEQSDEEDVPAELVRRFLFLPYFNVDTRF